MAKAQTTNKQAYAVGRQLQLITMLLTTLLTDGEFPKLNRQTQIANLHKLGFRNKELTEAFGISKQAVNDAIAKNKVKKK